MLEQCLVALEELTSSARAVELEDRIEFSFSANQLSIERCNLQGLLDLDAAVLAIDDEREESWAEIASAQNAQCTVNLIKSKFIESVIGRVDGASNLFFLSLQSFEEWMDTLPPPFSAEHPFNRSDKTVLWLNGIDQVYVGECLSVVPPHNRPDVLFSDGSYDLPSDENIRAQVHVLSDYSVRIEPVHFRLPNEAAEEKHLKSLFGLYQQVLASCLVKEFYSQDRVVISGIKRITTNLVSPDVEIKLDKILLLEESVRWVYAERVETRLLLLMDRLSLDLPDENYLLPSLFSHLHSALEQAQWRYEFVIKDRKEAHAKELADLQKDVKAASDGYSSSANELVSGLLKDVLSSIFILSIGLLSRLAGKDEFLQSDLFGLLSKGLAVYLVAGVIIRVAIGHQGLSLALNDLMYWKNVTRNHMSEKEFKGHVQGRTQPYKRLYCWSVLGVVVIHLILALFVLSMPSAFTSKKIAPESQVTQELANQPASQLEMGTAGQSGEKPTVASKVNVDSALDQDADVSPEEVARGVKEAVVDDHFMKCSGQVKLATDL